MRRPSHFVLLFTGLFAGIVWYVSRDGDGRSPAAPSGEPPRVARNPLADRKPRQGGVQVEGRVLDRFGWPVADVAIAGVPGVEGARTDQEGRFVLSMPALPVADLLLRSEVHAPAVVRVEPARRDPVHVLLGPRLPWAPATVERPEPPSGRLAGEGRIVDRDGNRVAGAVVRVLETGLSARTDATGLYRVGLPAGPCHLRVWHADGRAALEQVRSSRREGVVPLPDVVVEPAAALEGVVRRPDGEPVGGAGLSIEGDDGLRRDLVSRSGGAFRVPGLLAGSYTVTLHPYRGALGRRRTVEVDRPIESFEIALQEDRPLRLQVVDQQEQAQGHVHVLFQEFDLRRAHAQADADGWVRVRGLTGEDTSYEVRRDGDWKPLPVIDVDREEQRLTVAP